MQGGKLDRRDVITSASAAGMLALGACASSAVQQAVGASVAPSAVITVTDSNATATGADAGLSLATAIQLTNATLRLEQLSAAQRAQVQGDPGEGVTHIRFALSGGSREIIVPSPASGERACLPTLRRGVSLQGEGVTLRHVPSSGALPATALLVAASNVEINEFVFDGFQWALEGAGSLGGGGVVENVRIIGNQVTVARDAAFATRPQTLRGAFKLAGADNAAGGVLRSVVIASNKIMADRSGGTITFYGTMSFGEGAEASNGVIEDIEITNNEVTGAISSVWIAGGQAMYGGLAERGIARRIQVLANNFTQSADCPVFLPAGSAAGGGLRANANVLEDITVAYNTIEGYMALLAGDAEVGFGNPLISQDNIARRVVIRSNRFTPHPHANHCVQISGAAHCFPGRIETRTERNLLEDVSIRENIFERGGVYVWGGYGIGPAGVNSSNVTRRIDIIDNAFSNIQGAAVSVEAAVAAGMPPMPPPANAEQAAMMATFTDGGRAQFEDNLIDHVFIDGNVFTSNTTAIALHGAVSRNRAEDGLHRNTVRNFEIGPSNVYVANGAERLIEPSPAGSTTDISENSVTAGRARRARL